MIQRESQKHIFKDKQPGSDSQERHQADGNEPGQVFRHYPFYPIIREFCVAWIIGNL
jgi:hypothetical protein